MAYTPINTQLSKTKSGKVEEKKFDKTQEEIPILLEKQKERMRQVGSVEIPQEAFMAALKIN